jgi:hypothetical protein
MARTVADVRKLYDKLLATSRGEGATDAERANAKRRMAQLRTRYPQAFVTPEDMTTPDPWWMKALRQAASFTEGAVHVLNGDALAEDTGQLTSELLGEERGVLLSLSLSKRDLRRIRRLGPVQVGAYAQAMGRLIAGELTRVLSLQPDVPLEDDEDEDEDEDEDAYA